ncbi:minichromosome maintenance domain-containing protein 2-like isoform X3 [Ischnura elegans]|uniref:minichromosome maintenance domain-containing protein 2-like isoform X3 n=1 Tax=Ischnura elegans TaxID=197161 RepID=UPI001ED876DC|nr:minichromosome maintenance domain-containing protein 2-like isoform X3 [Ischnura elegans]
MMSEHENWRRSALRFLEISNLKYLIAREFNAENLSVKLKDTKIITVPKYLPLVVDLMVVADLSVDLAQLIINNPKFAEGVFIQALKDMIINDSGIYSLPETPSVFEAPVNQRDPWRPFPMHISFHLKGIPSYLFRSSLLASKFSTCRNLVAFKGILISLSSTTKYMRSGVYSCSDSMCPESIKRRISTLWKQNLMECHICSSNLVEHTEERDMGNKVKAILTLNAADIPFSSEEPLLYNFQRGIMVKFYDSLTSRLKLGEHYDVAGYMTSQGMYAYYVQKSVPPRIFHSVSWSKLDDMLQLKAELGHSPWSFFIAIASQLCSDLYPVSSFLHLKRGLLLSLASLVCMSQPIHILAVGSENLPAHRIMMYASRIASSCVVHSHQQPIMGRTRWQEELTGGNTLWFDAGSLYLAQGGICYKGVWSKQNREMQTSVLSAIEKGHIAIAAEKRTITSDLRLPLRSAVWTHSCSMKKDKLRPLIDVFGIPFTIEMESKEHDDVIQNLIQNSHSGTKKLQNWELGTKMFIQNLTSNDIKMDSNATKLIQDYFVASRRCRGLTDSDHCLPIRSINVIMQMAEAHARISMHPTVTQADALAAINLSEEALLAVYGQSLMPVTSTLRISHVTNWSQFSFEAVLFRLTDT